MTHGVRRIVPGDRTEGAATPGMIREEAIATDGLWAGFVRTEPGLVSGWHHHGEYETAIYVQDGAVRMEFGAGGSEVLEAEDGDFLYVAPRAVHREINPTERESRMIVVRSGRGTPVINVDGPDAWLRAARVRGRAGR